MRNGRVGGLVHETKLEQLAEPHTHKMASFASMLVVLSVSCVAVGGISKRQDTKDDVCSTGWKTIPERLLNMKEKS